MEISMIACIDSNNAIGNNNELLFKNKEDMSFFKQHTLNKPVIMGRRTFESIGGHLSDRTNIVLTSKLDYNPHPDVIVKHDIESLLNDFYDHEEVVIIGGEELYSHFISYASKLYLTKVHHEFSKVDSYFPNLIEENWQEIYFKEGTMKSKYPYTFHIYKKR